MLFDKYKEIEFVFELEVKELFENYCSNLEEILKGKILEWISIKLEFSAFQRKSAFYSENILEEWMKANSMIYE